MQENMSNFSKAFLLLDKNPPALVLKAAEILKQRVFENTGLALDLLRERPADPAPYIYLGLGLDACPALKPALEALEKPAAEGYRIALDGSQEPYACALIGADERGVLFAMGKLLRLMSFGQGSLELPARLNISQSPASAFRGHQLAYRPKTNAYDAWTPEIYDRYIQDLAIFGNNIVEILPPGTDDDDTNILMKYEPLDMMQRLSKIIHSYGMDVSVWYPNMFPEDIDEKGLLEEDEKRRRVFSSLGHIDHIFIPGGDPGRLFPKKLFETAERFIKIAREYHPRVKLWISPQSRYPSRAWSNEFFAQVAQEPNWLDGVCFAPWTRDDIKTLRANTPERYALRNYPDMCHSLRCQYPVPKWNIYQAFTLGREFVNPRPLDQKNIHNIFKKYNDGSVCYSEGINDDLNKFIWLDQEWDPETKASQTLKDYARVFISCQYEDEIARGLLMLEENLRGDFKTNPSIKKAYELWLGLEEDLGEKIKNNYRFKLHLLRALYDYYQQGRLPLEEAREEEALAFLKNTDLSLEEQVKAAREVLLSAKNKSHLPQLAAKINKLADELFELIGAQLTVSRHHAASFDRGAFVEALEIPLNDRRYILAQLEKAMELPTKDEAEKYIKDKILERTDPYEGGFYDNFGTLESFDRLENHDNYFDDPGFFKTPLAAYIMPTPHDQDDWRNVPLAWRHGVSILYQEPLIIRYEGLDPEKSYSIYTVYAPYRPIRVRLHAGEKAQVKIHDEVFVEKEFVSVTNDLPPAAYTDGKLKLTFTVPDGDRGPNVSEILIRKKYKSIVWKGC